MKQNPSGLMSHVAFFSLGLMIVNLDSIAGTEKTIAADKNIKETHTQYLSWVDMNLS